MFRLLYYTGRGLSGCKGHFKFLRVGARLDLARASGNSHSAMNLKAKYTPGS